MKSESRVLQVSESLQKITHNVTHANTVMLYDAREKLFDMLVLECKKISSQPQNPLNSVLALGKHFDDSTAQNVGKSYEKKIKNNQDTLNTLQSKLSLVKPKLLSTCTAKDTSPQVSYNDVITAVQQLQKSGLESALDFILTGKIILFFTKS